MPYRRPAGGAEEPAVTVRYGPFSLRGMDLALGVAGLGILLAAGLVALADPERLSCTREDGRVLCEHPRWGAFALDDVVEVRFVPYEGSKRSERGKTELIDRVGQPHVVFDGSRDEARTAYEAFDAFLRDESRQRFEHSMERPWWIAVFLGVLGAAALALAVASLRQTTSIRLMVWPRSRRMRVVRRWLGIPHGTSELPLDRVERVEVERGEVRSFSQRRYEAGRPAGRLVLVTEDGTRLPVVERLLPGTHVHDEAAAELRALLGHESEHADEALPPPAEAAARAPGRKKWSPVVKYLVFLGTIVAVAFGAQAVLDWHVSRTQGFLEVRCTHRCRMGGMECLPGGSWRSSFEPGVYTIEIWNPDAEGGWERARVRVQKGRTTRFVCRQGAAAD